MTRPRPARAKTASERVRQPTEIRRRLIVDAARTVIAERGLFATTMRDIAQASGVSVGTLTYHFTGIAEILAEVLQGEMDSFYLPIVENARGAPDATTALRLLVDGFFADDERTVQHWRLWLDFWALASHVPRYGEWQSEIYRDLHGLIASLLGRGAADGTLTVVEPARQAIEFVALLDGLVVQCYLPHPRLPAEQAREILRAYGRG